MKRLILFFLCSFPLFAEFNPLSVPDSSDIRRAVAEAWLYPPLDYVRNNRTELRTNTLGEKFQVRLEETDSTFAVIVAPQVMMDVAVYTEHGVENTISAEYPFDANGSWILIRDSSSGRVDRLKIFFSPNSDVYVQFYKEGNKTLADFIIGSFYLSRGIPLGIKFDSLYTYSFSEIYALTRNTLPWKYADIHPGIYDDKKQMAGVIKSFKNRIVYADDACYDEHYEPAYVTTGKKRIAEGEDPEKGNISLSPAGFLKWVVDGLVEPAAGAATYITPLLRPTVETDTLSYQSVLEQQKGIPVNFMLDWTRNLAAARLSILSGKKYLYENSGVDVTLSPFVGEITSKGDRQVSGYIANSGYQSDKLKPVLYMLAIDEPNYVYLAAVRRTVKAGSGKGSNGEFQFFDQCALIIPYFDKNGHFVCRVFENGTEYTLGQFAARYKGSFVHLCRVSASRQFFPLGSKREE